MEFDRNAKLLIINSNNFNFNCFNDNMIFLHFLFQYSKKHDKNHYAEYAFDLLQDWLAFFFNCLNNSNEIEAVKMGYCLMFFIRNGFFEADDLDEILSSCDEIVFKKNIVRQKKNELLEIEELFFLTSYLKERVHSSYPYSEKHHLFLSHLLNSYLNFEDYYIQNKTIKNKILYKFVLDNKILENLLDPLYPFIFLEIKLLIEQSTNHIESLKHEIIDKTFLIKNKMLNETITNLNYEELISAMPNKTQEDYNQSFSRLLYFSFININGNNTISDAFILNTLVNL